jgi:SAM-dependent methyltransferase
MKVYAIDHIQIAIPPHSEELARVFYGGILGLREIPKPDRLLERGGIWFERDNLKLHLGVVRVASALPNPNFLPAQKAHPGLLVEDLDELVRRCDRSGYAVEIGEGFDRFRQVYVNDPFGNRIEFLEMNDYYKEDLAYIHDVGYGDYAIESAPGILDILAQNRIHTGLIVDLGCGGGLSARAFSQAGYRVLGVDISPAAIAIARQRVPDAKFRVESLFDTEIPTCNAVTSIGECFNYRFDPQSDLQLLVRLFERVYQALAPGGMFIFDIAEPGQLDGKTSKGFTEGKDWIVLVEKEEDRELSTLVRRIVTLRKIGEHYRRDEEVHHLQLYSATYIARVLVIIGFQVEIERSYGRYQLPQAHALAIARKPMQMESSDIE